MWLKNIFFKWFIGTNTLEDDVDTYKERVRNSNLSEINKYIYVRYLNKELVPISLEKINANVLMLYKILDESDDTYISPSLIITTDRIVKISFIKLLLRDDGKVDVNYKEQIFELLDNIIRLKKIHENTKGYYSEDNYIFNSKIINEYIILLGELIS